MQHDYASGEKQICAKKNPELITSSLSSITGCWGENGERLKLFVASRSIAWCQYVITLA